MLTEEQKRQKAEKVKKELEKEFPGFTFIINAKPSWLVDPRTGEQLTLDIYCEELGLAIDVKE